MRKRDLIKMWFDGMLSAELTRVLREIQSEESSIKALDANDKEIEDCKETRDALIQYYAELTKLYSNKTRATYANILTSIMSSSLSEVWKYELYGLVKKDGDQNYYDAVFAIVDNGTDAPTMRRMIIDLNVD